MSRQWPCLRLQQQFKDLAWLIILLIRIISRMDTLQSILLKKTQRDPSRSKEDIKSKPKRKKRSESLETIFRLPKSMLDKFRPHVEGTSLKRERSSNHRMEQTIELGNIGQEYHHNLRRTILSQAKEILNYTKPSKTIHQQNNFMMSDQTYHENNNTNRDSRCSQYEKNLKTLNILQKAILKEDGMFQIHQNIWELQANRLPIIKKRQSKRRQLLAAFEHKHIELSPPRREFTKQKQYRMERRDFTPYAKFQRTKDEKMDIRGWDTPQFLQI